MKSLIFKTITKKKEACILWDMFSPKKTLDDEWDFRYAFFKYLKFPLRFIVGFDHGKPVGLLPLQLNTNKGVSQKKFEAAEPFLEFFGGIDTGDNKVFLLPGYEYLLPHFLKQIKSPAILAPLAEQYTLGRKIAHHYTDNYSINLVGLNDFDTFVETNLQGENRRRIRQVMNRINNNYTVEFKKGTEKDLEVLFELNKKRFGENSYFHMEHRKQIHRDFLTLFPHDLFTIYLNGEIKAVGMSIIHKKVYHGLISGYDYAIKDLGKFVFLSKMKRALELGCAVYDAGKNDNGWKEQLGLSKTPQYKLTINPQQAITTPTIPVALPLHTAQYLGKPSRSRKYLLQT